MIGIDGHLHHYDACADLGFSEDGGSVGKEHHATIVFQRWTDLHLNYILGASGTITPPTSWYICLSVTAVSAMARNSAISATVSGTNVTEIGTTAAGYARQAVARTISQAGVDWAASTFDNTLSTGGTSMAGDQVTFSFTGAPVPNGANSWFIGDAASPVNSGQIYMASDTAATRNFGNGDTEKVTATVKSG